MDLLQIKSKLIQSARQPGCIKTVMTERGHHIIEPDDWELITTDGKSVVLKDCDFRALFEVPEGDNPEVDPHKA